MKLIVKPTSSNLWWGIYGLTDKIGWEDMSIFQENGEKIGAICLNTKQYLNAGLEELKVEPEDADYVAALEKYLEDNTIHYWFYYDSKGSDNFYEVPYEAPKNEVGIKPSSIEIWHPDETIGIATIQSAVKDFAKIFVAIDDCQVQIENIPKFEDAVNSFKENNRLFAEDKPIKIKLSDALISDLSSLWQKSEEEVLLQMKKVIK